MLISVINTEANMLNVAEFFMFRINWTKDCEISKIVWRQVKAIVKPKVNVINRRICRLSSFLNLGFKCKNGLNLSLIIF